MLGRNGELICVGDVKCPEPIRVNIFRAYIDNDMGIRNEWKRYENAEQVVYDLQQNGNTVIIIGKMCKICLAPVMDFTLVYTFYKSTSNAVS